jgi:hypothetical protein
MEALWTWGGKYFGYRDGDDLWTHDGRHVGRFYYNEVYGPNGQYLGEIKTNNRLITCQSKKSVRRGSFAALPNRVGFVPNVDYEGYVMYVGYEDFHGPDEL